MFVDTNDYLSVIDARSLQVLESEITDLRSQSEQRAIELISSYLRNRYDVNVIFAATGDQRNSAVVSWVVDISLYNMTSRVPGRMSGDLRKERYDNVVSELRAIAKGEITPGLTVLNADPGNPIKFGSQKQYNNRW